MCKCVEHDLREVEKQYGPPEWVWNTIIVLYVTITVSIASYIFYSADTEGVHGCGQEYRR